MAIDAVFVLERLRCFRESSDGSGHSEPYIWPVLVWVDDTTLASGQVGMVFPEQARARVVIKNEMRAGDVADIPEAVGTLRARLDEGSQVLRMFLIVALLEQDETPGTAVRAGYTAFTTTLGEEIGARLPALAAATPQQLALIVADIKRVVRGRVESATRDALTTGQKLRVWLGELNLDDAVGAGFKVLSTAEPQPVGVVITSGTTSTSEVYAIDGALYVSPVPVDLCQPKVEGVMAAKAVVAQVNAAIRALKDKLNGAGPGGLNKAAIIADIDRLRDVELAAAEQALEAARASLGACRQRFAAHHKDVVDLGPAIGSL